MSRREFFIVSAAAAGAATPCSQRKDQAKLDCIAVMSYSFDTTIRLGAHANHPGRTIDILDFPDMIAHRYGVHHVEIQHTHFRSTEPSYLQEIRHQLQTGPLGGRTE